jgi:peroxiredoxin-like protein
MAAPEVHHVFKTSLRWTEAKKAMLSAEGKPDIEVATPAVFPGGHEGIWSPEEMFVAAADICTMTTFLAIIHRRGIELESYESEAEGRLDTT